MALSCNNDTSRGRSRPNGRAAAGAPVGRTHDVAGASLVPLRVRARWYAYLALSVAGVATGGAPAWALAGVVLACVATPLALVARHGAAGLRELFFIRCAPVIRRPNTELKELT
jgi:hypothetical protein